MMKMNELTNAVMNRIVNVGALKRKREELLNIGGGYADAVRSELTEHGLLINCNTICTRCKSCVMKGGGLKKVTAQFVDDEAAEGELEQPEDDEEDDDENDGDDSDALVDEVEEDDEENRNNGSNRTANGVPMYALVTIILLCLLLIFYDPTSLVFPFSILTFHCSLAPSTPLSPRLPCLPSISLLECLSLPLPPPRPPLSPTPLPLFPTLAHCVPTPSPIPLQFTFSPHFSWHLPSPRLSP